jgi:acyl-coenzyme A thioesterase PaaI-like protein
LNENGERQQHDRGTAVATPNGNGVWAEKRRLAAAMREVIDRIVTTEAPEDELRVAADRLELYARHLATQPWRFVTWGNPEASMAGTVGGFFDLSPLMGQANPLAPPMTLWVDGEVVRGKVTYGWAYQGPPGHLHGGCIAALFDEALGLVQSLSGRPGMTGTLTVRYRKPVPLQTELRIEGRVTRVQGRKIFTEGRLYAGDTLTAEAEGIFVSVILTDEGILKAAPAPAD